MGKPKKKRPSSGADRGSDGRFLPQNSGGGRPNGSKNKITKEGLLAAREAFAPVNEAALKLMQRHLDFHLAAQDGIVALLSAGNPVDILLTLASLNDDLMRGNCATCRHIFTLSSDYTFGKPTQRVEFDVDDFVERLREERPELDDEAANLIARRAQEWWRQRSA